MYINFQMFALKVLYATYSDWCPFNKYQIQMDKCTQYNTEWKKKSFIFTKLKTR